jgi:hypothetical protein
MPAQTAGNFRRNYSACEKPDFTGTIYVLGRVTCWYPGQLPGWPAPYTALIVEKGLEETGLEILPFLCCILASVIFLCMYLYSCHTQIMELKLELKN